MGRTLLQSGGRFPWQVTADFGENLSDADAIQAFVEAERSGVLLPSPNDAAQLTIRKVDQAFAERLKAEKDIDIRRMSHVIETGRVNHAFNSHGPSNEKDEDQLPISPEALSAYLSVVEHYDGEVEGPRNLPSGPTYTFRKRINGELVVVEQLRTKSNEFAFHTMRIEKTGKRRK